MSDLNEINRSLGVLEGKLDTMADAVKGIAEKVESLQQKSWTARGILFGIAALSGGAAGKIAALFGGPPPTGH